MPGLFLQAISRPHFVLSLAVVPHAVLRGALLWMIGELKNGVKSTNDLEG
jgi:hypothetical protein